MAYKNNDNILEPLVDGLMSLGGLLFETSIIASKVVFDGLGNIMYRLIEGKAYEGNVEASEDIEEGLEVNNIVKYEYVPVGDFKVAKEVDKVMYEYIEGEKKGLSACIGKDMFNDFVFFDMLNSHTLVGGASRWGKSSFLNTVLVSLMLTYTPNEVMFLGCDFKMSDIYFYRRYKHFRGMSTNKKQFFEQLRGLEEEINTRSKLFDKLGCKNAIVYNEKYDNKLPYIVFVVDELPQLTRDKDSREALHSMMQKSASFGIYFILATQDATKDTIGKCKMNCSQTVGLHTRDTTDSNTLIGYEGLEQITVKGRCHFDSGADNTETQIFFIDDDKIEKLLQFNLKEEYKKGVV